MRSSKLLMGRKRVSVTEIDALLYLPGHPRDQLERALRIPSLSAGWKGSLEALAEADRQGGNAGLAPSSAPPPAWSGFRSLRVAAVQRESVDVCSFTLESEDRSPLPAPLAGQFLVFKLELDKNSAPILRSYSMSGSQDAATYRVSVKRADGAGSHYFHEHIQAGDLLQVSAPRGSFTLATNDGPVVSTERRYRGDAGALHASFACGHRSKFQARNLVVLRCTQWQGAPICCGSTGASEEPSPEPFVGRL